ncbi:DNA-directed RNA polymerase III subunit RPC9 [Amphibalanus amphitrite]|uniref:DNA-directed RNA polymerase III subunit RPC9 n=1 Tax=Amphibalanus amphitrite TaxID=1232801 RepID=A0A6A4V965_AMPAM|nr:DNA-directed RNA polymerase III subunit RPC9-like isoform X2 [Amphibalanus amphitrite]XP_043198373.1 DNA-directed RNA polymerase III subunit RPC9-like isoform X2 [Amphibalanus amphitrite]XP_043242223.1 DNA-directed RNA polymerase III subunit RPC9-like [Amphibalanus amphitrite]XP_043242224.1 DNA-directed RNA polymerase III subunit RPC9-like [Amphibalanus amphitrite]XP_043242225.1 DNA-directed RNA polymerase III subunit RPC9-like [Amphibalanus amphitrite]XP_043242226.1 DNA-directed RNA polyme
MEILDASSAVLCNFEVYELLQDVKKQSSGKKKKSQQKNLATITYETLRFLESTPCKYQSERCIREFLLALTKFQLTKSEKLQLLNTRPTSAVEIQLIIEESEERLKDEEVEEILNLVKTLLPGPPEEAAADGAEDT